MGMYRIRIRGLILWGWRSAIHRTDIKKVMLTLMVIYHQMQTGHQVIGILSLMVLFKVIILSKMLGLRKESTDIREIRPPLHY
ncbi:hypothetical protein PEC302107_41210 [Pectobacterium araliae]|nr:hypothetical protein PEC302107_41210 [Pectobacterium carotovorum subsp. carotovorum]